MASTILIFIPLLLLALVPRYSQSLVFPQLVPVIDSAEPRYFSFPKSNPTISSPFSSHLGLPSPWGGKGLLIDQCVTEMVGSIPDGTDVKTIIMTSKAALLANKLDPSLTPMQMMKQSNPVDQPLYHLSNTLSSPLILIHRHDVPNWFRQIPNLNTYVMDGYGPWSVSLDSKGNAVCTESDEGPVVVHYCPGFSLGSCLVTIKEDGVVFSGNSIPMTTRLDEGGVLSEMKSVQRAMESLEGVKELTGVDTCVSSREGAQTVGEWGNFVNEKVKTLERYLPAN